MISSPPQLRPRRSRRRTLVPDRHVETTHLDRHVRAQTWISLANLAVGAALAALGLTLTIMFNHQNHIEATRAERTADVANCESSQTAILALLGGNNQALLSDGDAQVEVLDLSRRAATHCVEAGLKLPPLVQTALKTMSRSQNLDTAVQAIRVLRSTSAAPDSASSSPPLAAERLERAPTSPKEAMVRDAGATDHPAPLSVLVVYSRSESALTAKAIADRLDKKILGGFQLVASAGPVEQTNDGADQPPKSLGPEATRLLCFSSESCDAAGVLAEYLKATFPLPLTVARATTDSQGSAPHLFIVLPPGVVAP